MSPPNNGDEQIGLPIRELVDLEREPSPRFIDRIRRKIHRRTVVSQFASYSWHMPVVILTEMASLLSHLLKAVGTKEERER